MYLVKKAGDGMYPTSREHDDASTAFTEATRLAVKEQGQLIVVYAPIAVLRSNQEGALPVKVDCTPSGQISLEDLKKLLA